MAFYNLQKKLDRDRLRQERTAELNAVKNGTWPRNPNDQLRWSTPRSFPKDKWAQEMCIADLDYLDDLERRIATGNDPDLTSYEG